MCLETGLQMGPRAGVRLLEVEQIRAMAYRVVAAEEEVATAVVPGNNSLVGGDTRSCAGYSWSGTRNDLAALEGVSGC